MKKSIYANGFRCALLSILAMMAGSVVEAADTVPAEEWALDETVGNANNISVTPSGSAVTVWFASQGSPPAALRTDLLVGAGNPSSVFMGNLSEMGYSGVRLKITGTGAQPAESSVLIRRVLEQDPLVYRDWRYQGVSVSSTAGEWTIADIPLRRSAGWTTAGEYKYTAAQLDTFWLDDVSNVSAMYVRLQAGGLVEQSYSVSDFQLMGAGIVSEPANLSALQHYFKIDSLDGLSEEDLTALMALDSDYDGMSDYHEILAGFDPKNAASVFAAQVGRELDRNAISWNGVLGKTYAIWRANDLQAGFFPLKDGIRCGATGVMTEYDDSPDPDKPNFYKVVSY